MYTLCSVWGVVAGAPNQALSWQRPALTLPSWLVENIKNMVAGGELVADIKPTNFYVSLQTMFTGGQLSTIFPRGVRLSSVRGC